MCEVCARIALCCCSGWQRAIQATWTSTSLAHEKIWSTDASRWYSMWRWWSWLSLGLGVCRCYSCQCERLQWPVESSDETHPSQHTGHRRLHGQDRGCSHILCPGWRLSQGFLVRTFMVTIHWLVIHDCWLMTNESWVTTHDSWLMSHESWLESLGYLVPKVLVSMYHTVSHINLRVGFESRESWFTNHYLWITMWHWRNTNTNVTRTWKVVQQRSWSVDNLQQTLGGGGSLWHFASSCVFSSNRETHKPTNFLK